jgi:hypothetical protein
MNIQQKYLGGVGPCAKCGEHGYVMPLHDERGGPLFCFMCAGAWHAEHGPLRRTRRVVVKALRAYDKAGGKLYGEQFDELKLAAGGMFVVHQVDTSGADFADLTSELLQATIALTHPDKHPPERKAEANRVTQELQALKPFVFPTPEPEPPPEPRDASFNDAMDALNEPSRSFPCEDCRDALPSEYCDPCKAQHEKKCEEEAAQEEKERQKINARQRELYSIRKEQWLEASEPIECATCGETFEPKRRDAKYCSAACRQRASVKRDGKASNAKPIGPQQIERALVDVFTSDPDNAFTIADLCQRVFGVKTVQRKHRAAVIPVAKKVCEQLGENWDWFQAAFTHGNPFTFWNRASLSSCAMRHLKTWGFRHRSEKDLRDMIAPGGAYYDDRMIDGGEWWQEWQDNLAQLKDEKTRSTNQPSGSFCDCDEKQPHRAIRSR